MTAFDGLRGVTIVMVVVAHGWLLWPLDRVTSVPVLRGLFLGGTVTVFFVVGAYVVTRGLLADLDRQTFDPLRFYLRRLVRLGAQLSLLCATVIVLTAMGESGDVSSTRASVLHVMTYTWNIFLETDTLSARPDLGHLWYLSVQQQFYLALPLFLLLFGWSRRLAALLVAVAMVGVVAMRYEVWHALGYWEASLRVTTRSDGLLLGVLLALVLPLLGRLPGVLTRSMVPVALVLMTSLILTSGEIGSFPYLRWWGVAVMLTSGLLVAGIVLDPEARVNKVLQFRALARLGKASFSIYLWHYPLFWFMARHTPDWHWATRTLVALAVLTVIVVVMEILVEEPVRRLLARSGVFRLPRPQRREEVTSA